MPLRICKHCDEEFELKPGKPGLIDYCPRHSHEIVELTGGNMIWDHKTAPYIETKPMHDAKRFASLTRRLGAGVTRSITQSREPHLKDDGEPGSTYVSRLGEKRTVKL